MSDFVLMYRLPADSKDMPDSPLRMHERLQRWTAWFRELETSGKLGALGHPLETSGLVVKDAAGGVHDGPYAESKDIVIGYSIVQARDLAEARTIAAGCPVLTYGGMVEVRPIRQM